MKPSNDLHLSVARWKWRSWEIVPRSTPPHPTHAHPAGHTHAQRQIFPHYVPDSLTVLLCSESHWWMVCLGAKLWVSRAARRASFYPKQLWNQTDFQPPLLNTGTLGTIAVQVARLYWVSIIETDLASRKCLHPAWNPDVCHETGAAFYGFREQKSPSLNLPPSPNKQIFFFPFHQIPQPQLLASLNFFILCKYKK